MLEHRANRSVILAAAPRLCLQALPQMQRVAKTGGQTFQTQSACLEQGPVCIERSDVSAWAPRPASYCVARAQDGGIARIEAIYARR